LGATGAAALYIAANNIINGKDEANGMKLTIDCAHGASLILERRPSSNSDKNRQMETFFVITKEDKIIPFKFSTHPCQVEENGQMVTKVIESGLGAFMKIVERYLMDVCVDKYPYQVPENFDELGAEKRETPDGTWYSKAKTKWPDPYSLQHHYGNAQNTPSNW
jgi:hypothetical protein